MRICVSPKTKGARIRKEIYGNFSEHLGRCIYNGLFVGEDSPIPNVRGMRTDIVEALKEIKLPLLRWPGGCFADEYHWKDGIGPRENRKCMVNTHWGNVTEDNSFGTHEFMDFCEQVGCQPYICGNVGSGTVQEMSEWVEYMTSANDSPMTRQRKANGQEEPWKLKWFAVGNENWGCGGMMTAERYADEYRRYQIYCRNTPGNKLYKVACGPNGWDYHWTQVLMEKAGDMMDGLALHYYCGSGKNTRSATEFGKEDYYHLLKNAMEMEKLVHIHGAIMDRYDPAKRVGLIVDEWGAWHDVEPGTNPGFLYQQNTMRDAMVAALTLDIFNHHADRVHGANIAQLINVLQAVILTEGSRMLKTPTWDVFNLYQGHQEATLVSAVVESGEASEGVPAFSASASEKDGRLLITLSNLSCEKDEEVKLRVDDVQAKLLRARCLHGDMTDYNTFDAPDTLRAKEMDVCVKQAGGGMELCFQAPHCSVIAIEMEME